MCENPTIAFLLHSAKILFSFRYLAMALPTMKCPWMFFCPTRLPDFFFTSSFFLLSRVDELFIF